MPDSMILKVGFAQDVITPTLEHPVYLAGFGKDRLAQAVHDDLTVRALALNDGRRTLALAALDLVGFFRPHVNEVLTWVNRPALDVVLASTHTHHGPDTMGLWGPDDQTSGVDAAYLTMIKRKIAQTVEAAVMGATRESPALKATSVHVPGVAKNARNPKIVDDELTVLQCLDPAGSPIVSLFDFPCHPEVLWEHNRSITADYPGVLRREVEQATGAPCIFFSGALGGMMTPDVKDHSFKDAEAMGKRLAVEGLQALTNIAGEPWGAIRIQRREIKVELTNFLFKVAFRRGLLPDVRDAQGAVATEVALIKLGPLWLATAPGELLPKLGLALKADLRTAGARVAGIISLANDELGYILPREDFHYPLIPFKPGKHYEETMSVGKTIGPSVVEALQALLRE